MTLQNIIKLNDSSLLAGFLTQKQKPKSHVPSGKPSSFRVAGVFPWVFLTAGQMTMNLAVHTNYEAHLVLRQSLSMGQKSSHTPEASITPPAVICYGPQVLHTYPPTYLPTHLHTDLLEMSWTTAEATLAELVPHTRPQMVVTRQKTQHKPPEL